MILVTGGAGFIGSHLVEALVERGHPVRVLDDLSSGREEHLAPVRERVELLRGSVTDPALVERASDGVQAVFHLAAIASVVRSIEDPLPSHQVNATGTLCVLEAARRAGVGRVVLAGSASVYGDAGDGPSREDRPADPRSPYASQKLMSEQYARQYADSHGLATVILRYYNVFGPRQDPTSPYSGVISIFCQQLVEGTTPVIHGDGLQTRDFTYVANVVQANLLALERPPPPGTVLNVATGRSISIRELLQRLADGLGRTAKPAFAAPRAGDVRHSRADVRRAREVLGYEVQVELEEGLRRTLEWFRKERGA